MNSKVDFAAGGIVFYNNLIVIVKNKRHGEDSDNSFWGYPKGHLEDGEKPSDAALREVYEETGFKVKLANDTPIAESRYEITLENEVINKTVWFYEREVIKARVSKDIAIKEKVLKHIVSEEVLDKYISDAQKYYETKVKPKYEK